MSTLRRVGVFLRLLLLIGTPVAVVGTVFGWGLVVGHAHRDSVLHWESRLFGWEPPRAEAPPADSGPEQPRGTRAHDPPLSPSPKPPQPAATKSTPAVPSMRAEEPTKAPETARPLDAAEAPAARIEEASPAPSRAGSGGTPRADAGSASKPASADLEQQLALPVAVRVLVLVDDTVRSNRPDWIDYVQRLMDAASRAYTENFGIRFDLAGVLAWQVPTAGLSARALYDDLAGRSIEGMDVVVGLTSRPPDKGHLSGLGAAPSPDAPENGSVALVYGRAVRNPELPHLPSLLHELGHLFGAHDVTDPASEAHRAGSWMAPLPAHRRGRPWIDPDNRRRILQRKNLPFRPRTGLQAIQRH